MVTCLTPMLPRKRAFCDGIAAGLSGAEAARRAGYSERRAKQTASRLLKLPEVLAGIDRRRNGYNPNPKFDDPLKFLMWFANDPEAGATRQRVQAAIALLPYTHRYKR